MSISKKTLLERLAASSQSADSQNASFTPLPEDRGNSSRQRLKRLIKYRGQYVRHIISQIQYRAETSRDKDIKATTFWGKQLVLPGKDANARDLCALGTLGSNEAGLTRYLIQNLQPHDVFYDIGANYGFYTALAQELITEGEVHSFEPSAKVFSYLRQLQNKRTYLNNVAVGEKIGVATFFDSYTTNSSGKSTLSREAANTHAWDYSSVEVQMTTLDEYARTHTAPTMLKIDVEGYESGVIAGAAEMLRHVSPVIALELWSGELHNSSLKTLALLEGLGYTPHFLTELGEPQETTYTNLREWIKRDQKDTNFIFRRLSAETL